MTHFTFLTIIIIFFISFCLNELIKRKLKGHSQESTELNWFVLQGHRNKHSLNYVNMFFYCFNRNQHWVPGHHVHICSYLFMFSRTFPGQVSPVLPSLSPPAGGGQFLRCSWSFLRCFSFCFSILSRAFLSFSAAVWISLMRRFRTLRSDELSTPRPCRRHARSVCKTLKHS